MKVVTSADELERARGALLGLAAGDALGMPTQMLSRGRVRALYGEVAGFEPAPAENPISVGTPAGRVTDDTDQALLVAELLVAGGGSVDLDAMATRLIAWHQVNQARGSLDLLGPSTVRALAAYRDGVPAHETGRWGDTNGAAMRVAPVGIAVAPEPLDALVDAVAQVNVLTHDTAIANAGASAVAAAVSAGIAGASVADAIELGGRAAALGATRGQYTAGADVAARLRWATSLVAEASAAGRSPLDVIDALVGTGVATQESVPAAFALASTYADRPWSGLLAAAGLGGDSDTIGAMTGAILGAHHGTALLPVAALDRLAQANPGLVESVDALIPDLLTLRRRT